MQLTQDLSDAALTGRPAAAIHSQARPLRVLSRKHFAVGSVCPRFSDSVFSCDSRGSESCMDIENDTWHTWDTLFCHDHRHYVVWAGLDGRVANTVLTEHLALWVVWGWETPAFRHAGRQDSFQSDTMVMEEQWPPFALSSPHVQACWLAGKQRPPPLWPEVTMVSAINDFSLRGGALQSDRTVMILYRVLNFLRLSFSPAKWG